VALLEALGVASTIANEGLNTGLSFGSAARQQRNLEETWSREDNAIQRRVADLRAAGLSPVLAAGQGASASMAPTPITPQSSLDPVGAIRNVKELLQQKADISLTNSQAQIAREDAKRRRFDNLGLEKMERILHGETGMPYDSWAATNELNSRQAAYDIMQANRETALANLSTARAQATAVNRDLQFNINNNLYGEKAREMQSLSTWLNNAGIKDLSGPAAQQLMEILGKVLVK